ncbi:MAG TPA: ABC transporter permease, partial [Bryobacteraceae bacterium]|nr:ABC transporter permease [Bryobacteraceae bacterium]
MAALFPDLRFALSTLRRSPLFTSTAILSLALGIGANTAIFTLMEQLMLRLLPVKDPQQIVMLYQHGAHNGSNMGARMHSYPIYRDYQTKAAPFSEVICRREVQTSVSVDNQTERVDAELVSGNFFTMLGVKAAVGRVFNSGEDDRQYSGHPVVVLSHDYWTRRFAGDSRVVGKTIRVNNYPMTIAGVSAAGFTGLDPARTPQIRVPILMKPLVMPSQQWLEMENRRARWVQVFAPMPRARERI